MASAAPSGSPSATASTFTLFTLVRETGEAQSIVHILTGIRRHRSAAVCGSRGSDAAVPGCRSVTSCRSRPLLRQRAHRRAATPPHTSGCAAAAAGPGARDNPTRSVRPSSWHASRRINSLSRGVSPQGGAALQSRSSSLCFAQVQPPLDAVNSAIHLWRRICVAA